MIMERSGEERLKMGCSMFDTAKALMRAGILDQNPHASPAKLRRAPVDDSSYLDEFDADSLRTSAIETLQPIQSPSSRSSSCPPSFVAMSSYLIGSFGQAGCLMSSFEPQTIDSFH